MTAVAMVAGSPILAVWYYNDDYPYYPYASYAYTPYSQDCYQVRRIHMHNGWRTRRVNVCD